MSVSAPSSRAEEVRDVSQPFFLVFAHVEIDADHQLEPLYSLNAMDLSPTFDQLTMKFARSFSTQSKTS